MHVAVYCPLLCSLLFAAVGPRLTIRHLRPSVGMWTLTLGAGLSALASTWSLALLAGTLFEEGPPDPGGRAGAARDPVSDLVAGAAAAVLLIGAARLGAVVLVRIRMYRALREPCSGSPGPVVVLADPVPRAFAVPGGGGYVVVSQGMLAALTPAERRVLFAHERAHLDGAHHWHSGTVDAAAALNPLLIPLRAAGAHLCERAADEAAAAEVGDRGLAASSLARAALATAAVPARRPAMAYAQCGVGARVVALQRSPSRGRLGLAAALLGLVAVAMATDIDATGDFLNLVLTTLHAR